jgi:phosphate transport system protein
MDRYRDTEMDELFSKLFGLASLTQRALSDSIWALSHHDKALAMKVKDGDDAIDDLALEIDTESFQMIARYQPVANDLRSLEACIRIALDLERISDLAVSIAKTALGLDARIKPLLGLAPMGEKVNAMLDTVMRSLLERDASLAESVFSMDDEVDGLEDKVFSELFDIVTGTHGIIQGTDRLLMVARFLERAGDHVTNISEQICYMLTGRRIKATDYRKPLTEIPKMAAK